MGYMFLILPVLFLFFYFIFNNRVGIDSIFDERILEKLKFNNNTMSFKWRNVILFLALIFMIISISRPVMNKVEVKLDKISYDIVIGIDVSKSMLAKDIYPNRFKFAKEKFNQFVNKFKDANIGAIAFSQSAFLLSPLTEDSSTLKFLVDNLDMNSISTSGTDILSSIEIANKFLKKNSQKILVLFTDGGDNKNFRIEIAKAKEYNLNIYIYGIGTKRGITIEKKNGDILKDPKGKIVITALNEKIKDLAIHSNGAYIKASNSEKSINMLIKDIKSKFKKNQKEAKSFIQYKELFYYPLILALLCLLIAFSSLPLKSNGFMEHSAKFIFLLFIFFNTESQAFFLDFLDIDSANEAYEKKQYKKALRSFEEVSKSKESDESYYNLANAYYKNKNYSKAIENYKKVYPKNREMEFKILYNSANSFAKQKKFKEALNLYDKALKIKNDKDAKFNRNLIKNILKKRKNKYIEKKLENQENANENNKDKQKNDKTKNQESQENKYINSREEKKWSQRLKQSKSKTKPIQLETTQRGNNATTW